MCYSVSTFGLFVVRKGNFPSVKLAICLLESIYRTFLYLFPPFRYNFTALVTFFLIFAQSHFDNERNIHGNYCSWKCVSYFHRTQMLLYSNVITIGDFVLMMKDCFILPNEHTTSLRLFIHHAFNFIDSALKLTWYPGTYVSVLIVRARAKHYIYIKNSMKEKWLTSSREQRLWVRIQNPSRQLKTRVCKACCLMLSVGNEEKSTHTLPLCYKQSDNTLVVLHLHLMSVQAARYANVTRMWGVWTIVQPSPSPLGRVRCGVVFDFLVFAHSSAARVQRAIWSSG